MRSQELCFLRPDIPGGYTGLRIANLVDIVAEATGVHQAFDKSEKST